MPIFFRSPSLPITDEEVRKVLALYIRILGNGKKIVNFNTKVFFPSTKLNYQVKLLFESYQRPKTRYPLLPGLTLSIRVCKENQAAKMECLKQSN